MDGPVAPADCLAHWFDGTLKISTAQVLTGLSTNGNERDPWISNDRLTLYYAQDPMGAATSDIYRARRNSTAQAFGNATALLALNRSDADEGRAALAANDEKTLVLSSNRTAGQFDIHMITRADKTMEFPSPDTRHLASVNTAATQHFDPYLTADGLKLYLAPLSTSGGQHIVVATRTDADGDFTAPAPVPVINSTAGSDADPALSLDERIIVFTSTRPAGSPGLGSTNLWYATRPTATAEFSAPKLIPMVNGDSADGDPMLSADGCELYFSSTRGTGNDYDLYTAQIMK